MCIKKKKNVSSWKKGNFFHVFRFVFSCLSELLRMWLG